MALNGSGSILSTLLKLSSSLNTSYSSMVKNFNLIKEVYSFFNLIAVCLTSQWGIAMVRILTEVN